MDLGADIYTLNDDRCQIEKAICEFEEGKSSQDLTIKEHLFNVSKKYEFYVRNKETNQWIKVDDFQKRMARMQRRIHAWARIVERYTKRKTYKLRMFTLTYKERKDYWPGQITEFIKEMRDRCKKNLIAYAWVLEMQERGVPHYHVMMLINKKVFLPKPDKEGVWKYGHSNIEWDVKSPFYICAYTGKEQQKKDLPKHARAFAVWLDKDKFTEIERNFMISTRFPMWLTGEKEAMDRILKGEKVRRKKGGGWLIGSDHYMSPWELYKITSQVNLDNVTGKNKST